MAALLLPAMIVVLWIAPQLGWWDAVAYGELRAQAAHPIARLFLLAFITLSLFHWAHRFRYTLYDGLQLYHLNRLIAVITYGIATFFTLAAAWVALVIL